MTGANEGRPLFVRKPDAHFNLANFMRTHLYAALATLKIGLDIFAEGRKSKSGIASTDMADSLRPKASDREF